MATAKGFARRPAEWPRAGGCGPWAHRPV